ncbi:MAG: VanZ family protein [Thermodesulfobacteriota bacterium]|nr:VanZ family protein [Thermodesulfobacteriota bacterium]
MKNSKKSAHVQWFCCVISLAVLLPLFFWGGPIYHSSRSFNEFWNLGHLLFFMLFLRVFAGRISLARLSWSFVWKMVVVVLGCGVLIEALQAGFGGRTSSLGDVWRDMAGGIIGLVWVGWASVTKLQRGVLVLVVFFVVVVSIIPLGVVLVDEVRARRDFPILSSFETASELSRWHAKTEISQVKDPVRQGRFALRLPLTTDTYSGIGLKYFPRNWNGMKGLSLSIYNPEQSVLQITFRVHDRLHVEGKQIYADRFNRSLTMQPGWNVIFILMDDIKNAPANREMDLANIYGFGLFSSDLKEEKVIYIDDVRLVDG